jgi:hypothetical protein
VFGHDGTEDSSRATRGRANPCPSRPNGRPPASSQPRAGRCRRSARIRPPTW